MNHTHQSLHYHCGNLPESVKSRTSRTIRIGPRISKFDSGPVLGFFDFFDPWSSRESLIGIKEIFNMFYIYSKVIWILADCISDEILNFFVINFSVYWGNICVTSCCTERNYTRKVPFSMNVTLERATRVAIACTLIRVHRTARTDDVDFNGKCPEIRSWWGLDDWRVPKHCISSVVSKFAFW